MTDKTKACKAAGKKLYQQLEKAGVELTGYGVSFSDDRTVIAIRLLNRNDVPKVPTTFEGYEVETVVTGVIQAL